MVQSRLQRAYAIDEGPPGGPSMRLPQDELADRLFHCSPPSKQIPPGFLRLHARHVDPASKGAVLSDDAGLLVNWHLGPFIVGCT